jgi:hypothetical protein
LARGGAVNTRGKVALILATGLALFVSLGAAASVIHQVRGGGTPISDGAQQLLALALGGMVAALAAYISSGD